MANEPVTLNLKADVRLPRDIILPMAIVRQTRVARRFTIASHNQQVPALVAQFLREDPRYAGWHAETETASAARMTAAPAPTETPDEPTETPAEPWSETMVVPELRAYAARFGVELSADDKKADVVAKLRAARGDFEQQAREGEAPA